MSSSLLFCETGKNDARAILWISNYLATCAGYGPWIPATSQPHESITIDSDDLKRARNFILPWQLLTASGIKLDSIRPFIADVGSLSAASRGPQKHPLNSIHPLESKPLVEVDQGILVAGPCALVPALKHRLLASAIECGALDDVIASYWRSIDEEVSDMLRGMNYMRLERPNGLSGVESSAINESFWAFDVDKICCAIQVRDEGMSYDPLRVWQGWNATEAGRLIDDRMAYLSDKLGPSENVMFLIILIGIGRDVMFEFGKPKTGARSLALSSEDLSTIVRQRDADNLTIWKFAKVASTTTFNYWSILDLYAFYRLRDMSLYVGDDDQPDTVMLGPEVHHDLTVNAGVTWGLHAVPRDRRHLVDVIHLEDKSTPIWIPANALGQRLVLLVEGFPMPVWIEPSAASFEAAPERGWLFDPIEAVAYWIWKLTDHIRPWVEDIGADPIQVYMDIGHDFWHPTDGGLETARSLPFSVDATNRSIALRFSPYLAELIKKPLNDADRLIVTTLVGCFIGLGNDILGKPAPTWDARVQAVVESVAPEGFQKKLRTLDVVEDTRLATWDLPKTRYLQRADVTNELDGLGAAVIAGGIEIESGDIPAERCKDVLQVITAHFREKLQVKIHEFEPSALLCALIRRYEAVIHSGAVRDSTMLMAAACYGGAQVQSKRLARELSESNETAQALRFLIEFVSAEGLKGTERYVSDADYDEIVALSYSLINWGFVAEEIRGKTTQPLLRLLRSGRIGVTRKRSMQVDFLGIKALEIIESKEQSLSRLPKMRGLMQDEAVALDAVFLAEYSLTATELVNISNRMQEMVAVESKSTIVISESRLVAALVSASGVGKARVAAGIGLLTLPSGEGWNARVGDESKPWLFKRDLSYLRRPVVEVPRGSDCQLERTLVFGLRHIGVSVRHLLSSILAGNFRQEQMRSPEMMSFLGKQLHKRGWRFEAEAVAHLRKVSRWDVRESVTISPNGDLKSALDLGDVDILCFDSERKTAYAIECKDVGSARNPREMAGELEDLFEGKGNRKSKATKHLDRIAWLSQNWNTVIVRFGLSAASDWTLVPTMLVEQEIPSAYLIEPPLPVVAFSVIEREGIGCLEALSAGDHAKKLST
jgi:hypothetical protein